MNDRRLWFFLVAAMACALLIPAAPADLRWVPKMLAVVYVVLAALVALELVGSRGEDEAEANGGGDSRA